MDWGEIFRYLTPEQMEEADKDLDWILTALEDPSYLHVKGDNSNMFELSSDVTYYIEYIRLCLEEKGYNIVGKSGRCIGVSREPKSQNISSKTVHPKALSHDDDGDR